MYCGWDGSESWDGAEGNGMRVWEIGVSGGEGANGFLLGSR